MTSEEEVILSIDPSISHLGWALFSKKERIDNIANWDYGLFEPSKRCLASSIRNFLSQFRPNYERITQIIVEKPLFFNSEIGRIAAKEGYTMTLAWIGGYVAGYFRLDSYSYVEYTPSQWKGTMTKDMTRKKFIRDFHLETYMVDLPHDTIDAIMMLRYHLEHSTV